MSAGRSAAAVRRPAGRCPSGWSAESGRGPGGRPGRFRWIEALAGFYAGSGIEAETARDTAGSVIALLKGAFMLGRAAHDTAPVLAAARASAAIVRYALGRAG
ncbi:hypothetical protein ACGFN1_39920 [Streptomyces sp. NPDC048685]|uniref:LmrA/YxaF family transcription factor n=1 Tax=Streptomyces sp. NPDC048685 TaxID=3365584 RepID=UPI00371D7069